MKDLSAFSMLSPAEQEALLNGPALRPPPGVIPNFENPPNRDYLGYGIAIAAAVLCGLLILIRLYARIFCHKKVHIEDGVAVAALGIFGIHLYCVFQITINPGIFIHMWNIRLKELPHILYYMNYGSITYGNIIMLLKAAILLEWSRIFVPKGIRNAFWWTCHTVIIVNVLFYVSCTFIEIFGCHPRQKLWTPTLPGKCVDIPILNIASAIVNIVSDVIILLLPQKIIWSLHMTWQKKLGIAPLFAFGIFACISAGFRTKYSFIFANSDDILYNLSTMGIWSIVEMVSGFFVFCLPAMPKIFAEAAWARKLASTLKLRKNSSAAAQARPSDEFPAHYRWPKPRMEHDSLFSENWDKMDPFRATNIFVVSEFSVKSQQSRVSEV